MATAVLPGEFFFTRRLDVRRPMTFSRNVDDQNPGGESGVTLPTRERNSCRHQTPDCHKIYTCTQYMCIFILHTFSGRRLSGNRASFGGQIMDKYGYKNVCSRHEGVYLFSYSTRGWQPQA